MNIKPLGGRVLIKVIAYEEVTRGGIVLPDSAKEKPQQGEVIAVGPGRILDDGSRAPMDVKVGDVVIYAKYAGSEVKALDEDMLILDVDRDILAICEK